MSILLIWDKHCNLTFTFFLFFFHVITCIRENHKSWILNAYYSKDPGTKQTPYISSEFRTSSKLFPNTYQVPIQDFTVWAKYLELSSILFCPIFIRFQYGSSILITTLLDYRHLYLLWYRQQCRTCPKFLTCFDTLLWVTVDLLCTS